MSILSINVNTTGLVGNTVNPRRNTMVTTDNLAAVTNPGYLNGQNSSGNIILPTDIFEVLYSFNESTQLGTYGIFQVSYSASTGFSLTIWENPGNVLLPVTAGAVAIFNGTLGQIKSNSSASPTTATNFGGFQAGASGVAGTFISFPGTAANGSLIVAAVNAGGAFNSTISNGTMAQASVFTLPDPGNAVARFLVAATATPFTTGHIPAASGTGGLMVDSGIAASALQLSANIKAAAAAWVGGSTSHAFTITGLTTSSIVIPAIQAQATGTVYIESYTVTSNTLTVTFSADPGAMVLQYTAFIAPQ